MLNRVLVTGCTGMVGHGICQHLLKRNYEVWGTYRKKIHSTHNSFHPIFLDLSKKDSIYNIESILDNIDTIIVNAAKMPKANELISNNNEFFTTNMLSTYDLLKLSLKNKKQKVILISGTALVSNQNNAPIKETDSYFSRNEYISSKIGSEIICQQIINAFDKMVMIFRIRAPYGYVGNKLGVIPRFIELAKNDEDITLWGTGSRKQIFTFVEDIGHACDLAIQKPKEGVYNVTGAESTTMKDLAETIIAELPSSKSKIVYTGKKDPQENIQVQVSLDKAKSTFNYYPQNDLKTGLNKIIYKDTNSSFFEMI